MQGVQGCLGGVQGLLGRFMGAFRRTKPKKARMRGGCRGVQGGPGGPGVSGGVPGQVQGGVQRFWAEKRLKHQKAENALPTNIQDFVQEVPVGQMAQGTPFRCLAWPTISKKEKRGRLNL